MLLESVAAALFLRDLLLRVRNATAAQVAALWRLLFDIEDITASATVFGAAAASTVQGGQVLAVEAANAWFTGVIGAAPRGLDPTPFLGVKDTTVALPDVLASSGLFVWAALERGEAEEQARAAGLYRALRLTSTETMRAGTDAVADLASDGGSTGWRRQTGPNPCPICQGLADGSLHPWDEAISAHPHCSCIPLISEEATPWLTNSMTTPPNPTHTTPGRTAASTPAT